MAEENNGTPSTRAETDDSPSAAVQSFTLSDDEDNNFYIGDVLNDGELEEFSGLSIQLQYEALTKLNDKITSDPVNLAENDQTNVLEMITDFVQNVTSTGTYGDYDPGIICNLMSSCDKILTEIGFSSDNIDRQEQFKELSNITDNFHIGDEDVDVRQDTEIENNYNDDWSKVGTTINLTDSSGNNDNDPKSPRPGV